MVSILYTLLLAACLVLGCQSDQKELHIVYMGDLPRGDVSVASTHHSMLKAALGRDASTEELLVYSYERSFNGFAAKLTKEEAAEIAKMKGVVSVFPDQMIELHTTRSWDFMGFSQGKLGAGLEGDVIIGLIDTGAWPEHPSFKDTGYSPPPAKWKGACETTNFTCNNKLIGGRYYKADNQYFGNMIPSPRDTFGHGTHTATIAAGVEVPETSYYGLAEGVARGGVPGARVAVYKVCWPFCASVDILKAFDDAISDGVDILSVSVGFSTPSDYFDDAIAIGSFHAMRKGILTSTSAGNYGPDPVSVSDVAPWTMTVAASTIDRKFVANLVLGNGLILTGTAINSFDLNGTSFPLIGGGDAVNYTASFGSDDASFCRSFALNLDMVVGKIVVCKSIIGIKKIREVNGIGIILIGEDSISRDYYALSYQLPLTMITPVDGKKVMDYIRSTKYPTATILVGETWRDAMAPRVASFSSRGPNAITPEILMPDISAPGVAILAGWSPMSPPSFDYGDERVVNFNIASGTSMACPHASAAAAYVKAAHPHWSPAAIKSAIMTTALVMDPRKNDEMEFAYGSGHINPAAAIDPGLVFDASVADYVAFLCKHGYNTTTLRLITGDNATCANTSAPERASDVNYPAFALQVDDGHQVSGSFVRTVTNVGDPNSTYTATVSAPPSISVTVEPQTLTFSSVGETLSFAVNVAGPAIKQVRIVSGAVTWSDGRHYVRTPVVVYNYSPGAPYNVQSRNSDSERKMKHGPRRL